MNETNWEDQLKSVSSFRRMPWQGFAAFVSLFLWAVDIKLFVHYGWLRNAFGSRILLGVFFIMVPLYATIIFMVWAQTVVNNRRRKILEARSGVVDIHLAKMRTMFPPNDEVLHHLNLLGYGNVVRYIRELEQAIPKKEPG